MKALFFGIAWSFLVAQEPMSYETILSRSRPGIEELETEAYLAERQRDLKGLQGLLREGPTLSVAGGPRKGEKQSTDRVLEMEFPLFLHPALRREAQDQLGKASPLLRSAARLELRLRLRRAYLDAWLESEKLQLLQREWSCLEKWLHIARARVEAGADPAFQASLVAGEVLRALSELEEASLQTHAAWGRLRVLAELPENPLPLQRPDPPSFPEASSLEPCFRKGLLWKILEARLSLDQTRARLEEAQATSRWSLRAGYSREGEDQVTRMGLAFRLPRAGEDAAHRRLRESQEKQAQQNRQREALELEARFQSLQTRLESLKRWESPQGLEWEQALQAVDLRLQEGRDRPSEALQIRRQLLEAQKAELVRTHALQSLALEIEALCTGDPS